MVVLLQWKDTASLLTAACSLKVGVSYFRSEVLPHSGALAMRRRTPLYHGSHSLECEEQYIAAGNAAAFLLIR